MAELPIRAPTTPCLQLVLDPDGRVWVVIEGFDPAVLGDRTLRVLRFADGLGVTALDLTPAEVASRTGITMPPATTPAP